MAYRGNHTDMKTCRDCTITKSGDDFYVIRKKYKSSYCKPCAKVRSQASNKTEKSKANKRARFQSLTSSQRAEREVKKRRAFAVCSSCELEWLKRYDSIKKWNGLCRRCSAREVAARPEMRAIMRRTGIAVMKRVGRLPTPKMENRGRIAS